MSADLISRLPWDATGPLAELSSTVPPLPGNPSTLQLALIGLGTLGAFALGKRAYTSRAERRRVAVARQALEAVTAQATASVVAPNFAESTPAASSETAAPAA